MVGTRGESSTTARGTNRWVAHRFSGGGREYLVQFASPTAKAMGHPAGRSLTVAVLIAVLIAALIGLTEPGIQVRRIASYGG